MERISLHQLEANQEDSPPLKSDMPSTPSSTASPSRTNELFRLRNAASVIAQDAAAVVSAVLAAVASGEITPTDAAEVGKLIDSYVKAYETAELAERLERLERMSSQ